MCFKKHKNTKNFIQCTKPLFRTVWDFTTFLRQVHSPRQTLCAAGDYAIVRTHRCLQGCHGGGASSSLLHSYVHTTPIDVVVAKTVIPCKPSEPAAPRRCARADGISPVFNSVMNNKTKKKEKKRNIKSGITARGSPPPLRLGKFVDGVKWSKGKVAKRLPATS